ncbi:MaoC family dehydratase [Achromobacter sp. Marseille-Q0513]|uniref:MaoC family dehydratase n=1 Tax=Achromobacter sp. Marseille-Q0513 TaxID=2829161 RepID=UPI001B982C66|nr:MaoC family dehydratase [Achromobacter sp. Marseille-Q0513]MBR8654039.1 MaoC family dehydratase [Achromobacter sp. Marseille-Q0513]
METGTHRDARAGDELPGFAAGPLSRLDLALYCGASGDHNPIHVDLDFARAAGMDDVFAHGMLSAAYLARLLTNWAPQPALREYAVRFVAITHVGDEVRCSGRVLERFEAQGETRLRVELQAYSQAGELRLSGMAVLAVR